MKAYLTKVSLALLSTVFLLGCQDMGSGPVGLGPEFTHKDGAQHGKGGGGGPKPEGVLVDVIVTNGMDANLPQMELVRKGDVVKLRGLDFRFLKIEMTKTYAEGWPSVCETGHGDTAVDLMNDVFLNLIEDATGEVLVRIDGSDLVNGDHALWVTNGPDLVKVSPETVTVNNGSDINSNNFSVTFSGGRVKLGGTDLPPSPPKKFASQLFCDNLDEITVTVGTGG